MPHSVARRSFRIPIPIATPIPIPMCRSQNERIFCRGRLHATAPDQRSGTEDPFPVFPARLPGIGARLLEQGVQLNDHLLRTISPLQTYREPVAGLRIRAVFLQE